MTTAARIKMLLFSGIVFLTAGVALSQSEQTGHEKRVALIIGNADYLNGPLQNPVNDARSMTRALRNAGFEVILKENVSNKGEMKKVIRDFGWKLMQGGVGLFYYAGHGLQVDGFNFLVPVNAVINHEEEVEYECVEAGFVTSQMEAAQNRLNIVILDACRNNPFARSFRSSKQGLAGMNAPTGTLVAYSTAPGSVASDGSGFNGMYTEALLNQVNKPDLKIEEVFKNVRAEVLQKSNGKQTPWESSSLVGDFYFNPMNVAMTYNSEIQNQPATKPPSPPPATNILAGAQWRANSTGYWFLVNGQDVTDFTEFELKGNDLVVTHTPTNNKYLLSDYKDNRDGITRTATLIYSPPKNNSGSSINAGTIRQNEYSGNNPLRQIDNGILPTRYKPESKIRALFQVTSDYKYFLIYGGRDISGECIEKLYAKEDLYVFHPQTGLIFLLEGFSWANDNRPRVARYVRFK